MVCRLLVASMLCAHSWACADPELPELPATAAGQTIKTTLADCSIEVRLPGAIYVGEEFTIHAVVTSRPDVQVETPTLEGVPSEYKSSPPSAFGPDQIGERVSRGWTWTVRAKKKVPAPEMCIRIGIESPAGEMQWKNINVGPTEELIRERTFGERFWRAAVGQPYAYWRLGLIAVVSITIGIVFGIRSLDPPTDKTD